MSRQAVVLFHIVLTASVTVWAHSQHMTPSLIFGKNDKAEGLATPVASPETMSHPSVLLNSEGAVNAQSTMLPRREGASI